jgi:hypothetical protein
MALYKDSRGNLHDDMDGTALSLPIWPKDAVLVTDDEVAQIHDEQVQQSLKMAPMEFEIDPVQKLKDFLIANPDVLAAVEK